MKTNIEKDEKKCWKCKRTLVGRSNSGLCPDCLNIYGSLVASIGIVGIINAVRGLVSKNAEKLAKPVINLIKHIKS